MNQVNCPVCGMKCVKSGKTKAGSQRWLCKNCKTSLTHKINNESKELQIFLDWLFGKESQSTMSGEGRSFRRKTAKFWDIWAMPPKIAESRDVVFLDGIYLGRKACVLICCDEKHVLGWYLCRYEHAGAWIALMKRIAEPRMVVSDGGTGFAKALKKAWPKAKHQRCRELHEWVAKGRSPYDNGDYICGAGGYPLDFISALRAEKELQGWFDSLSEAEKEAERQGRSYQYATETDEIYFDISTFQILMQKTMTCPSNNMRINKNNAKSAV